MSEGGFKPVTLDASLDDIEDLPNFVVPLSGAYRCLLVKGMEEKKIGEHPAVEVAHTIKEVMELSEQPGVGEEAPKAGDVFSLAFMMDNQFGAGKFKEYCKPLGEKLRTTKLREIASNSKGLEVVVVIQRTYDDKKKQHYANAKRVAVL